MSAFGKKTLDAFLAAQSFFFRKSISDLVFHLVFFDEDFKCFGNRWCLDCRC